MQQVAPEGHCISITIEMPPPKARSAKTHRTRKKDGKHMFSYMFLFRLSPVGQINIDQRLWFLYSNDCDLYHDEISAYGCTYGAKSFANG